MTQVAVYSNLQAYHHQASLIVRELCRNLTAYLRRVALADEVVFLPSLRQEDLNPRALTKYVLRADHQTKQAAAHVHTIHLHPSMRAELRQIQQDKKIAGGPDFRKLCTITVLWLLL